MSWLMSSVYKPQSLSSSTLPLLPVTTTVVTGLICETLGGGGDSTDNRKTERRGFVFRGFFSSETGLCWCWMSIMVAAICLGVDPCSPKVEVMQALQNQIDCVAVGNICCEAMMKSLAIDCHGVREIFRVLVGQPTDSYVNQTACLVCEGTDVVSIRVFVGISGCPFQPKPVSSGSCLAAYGCGLIFLCQEQEKRQKTLKDLFGVKPLV
ncbi:hypothetical protein M8C21_004177 [Ambrosia artemisiifolia]|uniref:Uncharacterized protein n=1 Tax=Ambrosia artemisiifolia TaxID=4212 RepID=A0AAD5CEH0_AMBAR|nr:hypothetical protein M8C21_004177 [Ambrosia artemisiifolia]